MATSNFMSLVAAARAKGKERRFIW